MFQSILAQTAFESELMASSVIGPRHGRGKRSITADLLLTALIDAFSILVIFLLMSFSSTGEVLFINKNTELPKSAQAEMLERQPVVKVGKLAVRRLCS